MVPAAVPDRIYMTFHFYDSKPNIPLRLIAWQWRHPEGYTCNNYEKLKDIKTHINRIKIPRIQGLTQILKLIKYKYNDSIYNQEF